MRLIHVSAALLVASVALASDPAKGPRLPSAPVVPPAPMPDPQHPVTLADGVEYVVDFEAPCIVRSFPKSRVSVETIQLKAGETLLLPGLFIDGAGRRETRRFAGPLYVYRVSAAEDGACELMVLPVGGTEADLIVRPLLVKTGQGPQPPPPTPPGPGPQPKPPQPVKSFRVVIVYESGDTPTAAQQAVLFGKVVEEYLTGKCTGGKDGWGRRDKDTDPATDTTALKDLWAAVKPKVTTVPALAIAVNEKVTLEPLPATPADAVALLEKYRTGGK